MDDYAAADAVGHRVVHGGDRFREPTPIDDRVLAAIEELTPLAPLHNEPALRAIRAAQEALPELPHVAVFDTAFHATIPEEAATYAIPRRWREDWGIRRYGFHGIAVQSVAARVDAERLVVCHLGVGVWRFDANMLPTHLVHADGPHHHHLDNCAFGGPDRQTLYITEALSGDILMARMPVAGKLMYGLQ